MARSRAILSTAVFVLVALRGTNSWDSGHHHDIARSVLTHLRYSRDAVDTVLAGTFLVVTSDNLSPLKDWWSYMPTVGRMAEVPELQYLHADSLFDDREVESYWYQLGLNVLTLLRDPTTTPERVLVILGLTAHAAADFHSHSVWGQSTGLFRRSCECFHNASYFTDARSRSGGVYTGACKACTLPDLVKRSVGHISHGDYCYGVNRDSYERPGWEEGVVGAFFTTLDWVAAVERWAGAKLAAAARDYRATSATRSSLDTELHVAFKVAAFMTYPSSGTPVDGHYKGPYSGSALDFSTSLPSATSLSYSVRTLAKSMVSPLVKSLYSFTAAPSPSHRDEAWAGSDPSQTRELWNAVVVRVPVVQVQNFYFNTAPYLVVTVDEFSFKETPMSGKTSSKPYWASWAFVPAQRETVLITVSLWNWNRFSSDALYDVSPNASSPSLVMTYNVLTHELRGDVSGVHDSEDDAVVVAGSGSKGHPGAKISLAVFTRTLGNCDGEHPVDCPQPPLASFCK